MSKKAVRGGLYYLGMCLMALAFLLFYSFYTSPLTPYDNGMDAAFFRLVGQGMTRGLLPYRDFFDMKGPYLFFAQYIGQLICYGRTGAFLVQWINLTLALVLAGRIFELTGAVKNRYVHFLLVLPILWIAAGTFEGGNLTEEFSLVPLLLCALLCLKYLKNCGTGEAAEHRPLWAMVYGACFGYIALIRLTNAAFICAVVLTICIILLREKRFMNLLRNAGMFLLGVLAAFLPAAVFFAAHGMLWDMLYTVFVFGFTYFAEKPVDAHIWEIMSTCWLLLPTVFAAAAALIYKRDDWRYCLLAVLASGATVLAISSGNTYFHYYTLAIPVFVLGEYILLGVWRKDWSRWKKLAAAALVLATLLGQVAKTGYYTISAYEHLTMTDYAQYGKDCVEIASYIPEEDSDSVFGYNIHVMFYTYTDLFPCNKYCGWLEHYIELTPQIAQELAEDLQRDPPKWVIFDVDDPQSIGDFLETQSEYHYTLRAMNGSFFLYSFDGEA